MAGVCQVTFEAVIGGVPQYTLFGRIAFELNPSVNTTTGPALVGIPTLDAAWVAAARAQVPDGDDGATRDGDGTAGELATIDASGNAVRAGYAADTEATAGSVVRRGVDGSVLAETEDGVAIDGEATGTGVAVRGVSNSGRGGAFFSETGAGASSNTNSGTYHHVYGAVNSPVSAIARATGALVFLGDDAETNRAVGRTELGLGTIATQAANNVAITGGAISGITDLAIADGGTGASTVDGARANLGLAAVALPPRHIDHAQLTFSATDIAGSGAAQTVMGCYFNLTTGATANSTVRHRVNDNGLVLNWGGGVFATWARKLEIVAHIRLVNENAEGVLRLIYGKPTTQAFGLAAANNYAGVTIENASITGGFVCKAGVVTPVAFTPVSISGAAGGVVFISSLNGTISWYINGILAGTTTAGPTVADAGTINYEIQNGATAAIYRANIVSQSWGY
jgi:hypothetical protein